MPIRPEEIEIRGQWIRVGGKITGDEAEKRIDVLIHGELEKLGKDTTGWEILYRDPSDGRLWELTWPKGEMHGGGPKRLHVIDPAEAHRKYGIRG